MFKKFWYIIIFVAVLAYFGFCAADNDDDESDVLSIGSNDWDFAESKRIHILFSGLVFGKHNMCHFKSLHVQMEAFTTLVLLRVSKYSLRATQVCNKKGDKYYENKILLFPGEWEIAKILQLAFEMFRSQRIGST